MFDETFSEAWHFRYGQEPGEEFPDLAPFLRHRSVRSYSDQAVPESLVSALVACAQSAATSSNLQMWSLVSVQDPERREVLAQLCGSQNQIRTAPWFFAFVADYHRIQRSIALHQDGGTGLDTMEMLLVACIDTALAAERMVVAAEAVGLGICYIGALRNHPTEVAEALNLPEGAFGVFGLCLGYPEVDSTAEIKPRLNPTAVWHREQYDREADFGEYDRRMAEFYVSQGMKPDPAWSLRSAKRADIKNLSGRETLKVWLAARGMGSR